MRLLLLLIFAVAPALGAAAPQEFGSGSTRTHVVELFTSEGCSSCPPAEAWLGKLRSERGLWRDFVPMAWHVDYWDNLGWKDRFAHGWATARERAFAKSWKTSTVYTPCVVLDGMEWKDNRRAPAASSVEVGVLRATYRDGQTSIAFEPLNKSAMGNRQSSIEYEAHVAILGGGIVSKVTRGENSGSTLRHDFVVLSTDDAPLVDGIASIALAPPRNIQGVPSYSLAIWITRRGSLEPVQATGGPLKD